MGKHQALTNKINILEQLRIDERQAAIDNITGKPWFFGVWGSGITREEATKYIDAGPRICDARFLNAVEEELMRCRLELERLRELEASPAATCRSPDSQS